MEETVQLSERKFLKKLYQEYLSVNRAQREASWIGKESYEFLNILERYFITLRNGIPGAIEKLSMEMREKGISSKSLICLHGTVPVPEDLTIEETEDEIKYGILKIPKTPRTRFLIDKAGVSEVVKLSLRYESLLPRGQQWGVPWEVARVLFEAGFTNEGFASPWNSRYIEWGGKYCSVYKEDQVFGSLGSFFEKDLSSEPGGWSINPPMIESLIEKMVDHILKYPDIPIFVSLGNWWDLPGYNKLRRKAYHKQILARGTYYYQTPNREIVKANFDSVYFLLGPPVSQDVLEKLRLAWIL